MNARILPIPERFQPPIVKKKAQGLTAFHRYDWVFASASRNSNYGRNRKWMAQLLERRFVRYDEKGT
jgi:hypothetical protein